MEADSPETTEENDFELSAAVVGVVSHRLSFLSVSLRIELLCGDFRANFGFITVFVLGNELASDSDPESESES